ncbi:MAG: trigger factor [Spirochaetes bacterium]|nr:trigger factor [Spirochaetota bacterium]
MAATKEFTRLENSSGKLSLTVPKEDVRQKYQKMVNEYLKTISLPGFRKGKVPQSVLERKLGDGLKEDLKARLIEEALTQAFEDEAFQKYLPLNYSTPEMKDAPELDFDSDFNFSVVYDVYPEVKLDKWKGLEVTVPWAEITDADLQRELEGVREANSYVSDRGEEDTARTGDVATVDYLVVDKENGQEIAERKDFTFTIGSGNIQYKLEDGVLGMKKGENKEFETEAEGKAALVKATLVTLKEKHLPELDDELAQDVSEKFNTLDDLKNDIRKNLTETLEEHLKGLKIEALMAAVKEKTEIVLPESMIRAELKRQWYTMARRSGVDENILNSMLKNAGESGFENLMNDERVRKQVESAICSRLIMQSIMEEEKIEAGDAEITEAISKIVDSPDEVEAVKAQYQKSGMTDEMARDIEFSRLSDLLLAENSFILGEKQEYLDLMRKIR